MRSCSPPRNGPVWTGACPDWQPRSAHLQGLEPAGIGGRDRSNACCCSSIRPSPTTPNSCKLIEHHLDAVARNKWPRVAKAMGLDVAAVRALVQRLAPLDPRPLGAWIAYKPPFCARKWPFWLDTRKGPCACVWTAACSPRCASTRTSAPRGDPAQPKPVRAHLRRKLEEARALGDAVRQRQATLMRVAQAVFLVQQPFLETGAGALRPLAMQTVAESLGVAVSTISRAVAGKYVDTPHGVWALREFFQGETGGQARGGLRERLQAMVQAEDTREPLSDEALVNALRGEGFDVARRTVAKYRRELGIPSSYRRVAHA
ncbi:MAG: hypothetical protein R3E96_04410 [Planctomycetota bacterium]